MAVTYYDNNKYYLWCTETISFAGNRLILPNGYPITTSLLSIIFSSGSILLGLWTGLHAARDVAFFRAIKSGNVKKLQWLNQLGDKNVRNSRNFTGLILAAEKGNHEAAHALIKSNVRYAGI